MSEPTPDRPSGPVELDHLVLVVSDVERTLAWYQEHVHLVPVRVAEWRGGDAPFPSLRVTAGTIIDVIPGHDGQRGHLDHICFTVTDVHMAEARRVLTVLDEGARFGARGIASSIYVHDPDGLTVELRVYPPEV
jgi:catechol 2,3-dioxygenase-like lactoylglutathione lyase family enzyme